ncbi:cation:proton antiporter domain-containing protein [Halocatena pleomorpha]|uniref:Sodium:proton antiporter n=1 Tax=Halocatena pleomorpha TaxID=1785090 RepID=A0A3P3RDD8_9EURY|nr:cation:proton antiporter [Halocatena pleomorpha]RRJ31476.1 sodium:proton antiporter [Halocatena pleomorpha]
MHQPAVIEPLTEHALLILFVQLFLLLLTARGLGEIAQQVTLPAVVGELLAGIVLGPSFFGALAPNLFTMIFPQLAGPYHLIEVVSWFGLLMLLVVTGFETDLELIASRARSAVLVSAAGIVIPFVTGFGLGYVLPATFLAADGQRFVFSLFIAVAMSISAIPVIAKVLLDIGAIHRDIGQITIAAGMIDDTIGWILLSIVAALAKAGTAGNAVAALGATGETILWLFVFLLLAFTLGRRLAESVIRWVDSAIGGQAGKITTLMVLALGVGSITQYIGVEAVLGAFVVGLLIGQVNRFDQSTRNTFETMTLSVFAPIFFAMAGLRVDLTTLTDPVLFGAGLIVLGVATVGKFGGAFIGARAAGLSRWEGIAMGAGMNARGAIEIIVATIGLSIGVLSIQMYSIIVMVALVTSLTAPPLLRKTLAKTDLSAAESERLERRTSEQRRFLGTIDRVLLPTRCGVNSLIAAQLLGHVVRERDIDVTCLYVDRDRAVNGERDRTLRQRAMNALSTVKRRLRRMDRRRDSIPYELQENDSASDCLQTIDEQLALSDGPARLMTRTVTTSVSDLVLSEAEDRYDLLVLGMSNPAQAADRSLLGGELDRILRVTPCPILAVSSNTVSNDGSVADLSVRRILLPTIGTQYSRHAAEVAFAIGADRNAVVEIMHVVTPPQPEETLIEPNLSEAVDIGEAIVDREAKLGQQMGVEVLTHVSVGDRPERDILTRATKTETDVIVMGCEIRPTSRRAFLGPRVEHVIENASCPVAVVSSV